MRKTFVPLLLVLAFVLPMAAVAQDLPGCCTSGQFGRYEPNPVFGTANHGCAIGDAWVATACVAPPIPTVGPAPTAVPPPYVPPNEIKIPGWLKALLSIFAPKFVIPFAALISTAVITLTQIVKQLLALFGAKLGPRGIFIANAFMALLTTVGTVAAAGVIEGGMWLTLLTAVLAFLGSWFGYRITFADAAKAKLV